MPAKSKKLTVNEILLGSDFASLVSECLEHGVSLDKAIIIVFDDDQVHLSAHGLNHLEILGMLEIARLQVREATMEED